MSASEQPTPSTSTEAEERLRLATEAGGIGIWEWNLESGRIEYSPIALAIFGFPPDARLDFPTLRDLTHEEDAAITLPAVERALDPAIRSEESYRYRIRRADTGEIRWIFAKGKAHFAETAGGPRAISYVGTLEDISDLVAAEQAAMAGQARLRMAMAAAGLAVWELDTATGHVTPSPELNRLYGFPDDATPTLDDLRSRYAPGEAERMAREGADAEARGDTSFDTELKHVWPDGTIKWLTVHAQIDPTWTGPAPRIIGVVSDITERKMAEERLQVIAGEMQHRLKNQLALVQTLAAQTFRGDPNVELLRKKFEGRLGALSTAVEVLGGLRNPSADLYRLAEEVVSAFGGIQGRVRLTGPHVDLDRPAATNLAMALHELATNAAKYGALSNETGIVDLSWVVEPTLTITWQESGGPPVTQPKERGFGTRLMAGIFAAGELTLLYRPEGLRVTMQLEKPD